MGLFSKFGFKVEKLPDGSFFVSKGNVRFHTDSYGGSSMQETDPIQDCQEKMRITGADKEHMIVIPKANEIQIDYDSPELPLLFPEVLDMLARAMQASLTFKVYQSMSGNRHVVIECPRDLSDLERIAWQAVFASDPKREALSLVRISAGKSNPSLLIHRKDGLDLLKSETHVYEKPTGRRFR